VANERYVQLITIQAGKKNTWGENKLAEIVQRVRTVIAKAQEYASSQSRLQPQTEKSRNSEIHNNATSIEPFRCHSRHRFGGLVE
jgi:hypothetical protein